MCELSCWQLSTMRNQTEFFIKILLRLNCVIWWTQNTLKNKHIKMYKYFETEQKRPNRGTLDKQSGPYLPQWKTFSWPDRKGGSRMTTLSRYQPHPDPVPSWPTMIRFRWPSETASTSNVSICNTGPLTWRLVHNIEMAAKNSGKKLWKESSFCQESRWT